MQIQIVAKYRSEDPQKREEGQEQKNRHAQQGGRLRPRLGRAIAQELVYRKTSQHRPAEIVRPEQQGAQNKEQGPTGARWCFQVSQVGQHQSRDQKKRKGIPSGDAPVQKTKGPEHANPNHSTGAVCPAQTPGGAPQQKQSDKIKQDREHAQIFKGASGPLQPKMEQEVV